jgi:hypothetical protein
MLKSHGSLSIHHLAVKGHLGFKDQNRQLHVSDWELAKSEFC